MEWRQFASEACLGIIPCLLLERYQMVFEDSLDAPHQKFKMDWSITEARLPLLWIRRHLLDQNQDNISLDGRGDTTVRKVFPPK